MDKLVYPTSFGNPSSSPSSLFSVAGGSTTALEFVSCEISDQWLGVGGDDDVDVLWGNGAAADNTDLLRKSGEPPAAKRRGRKPAGSRAGGDGHAVSHVEAERQRRDKLNRRFCDLRAAVPKVTRMDKASLLADATSYIAELRGRVEELEAGAKKQQQDAAAGVGAGAAPPLAAAAPEEKLEVRMLGREAAALRLTSAARHGPARLMDALRQMDLPLQRTCVCRAGGVTVQDAVVDVPAGPLQDEAWLRAALLHRLQGSGCLGFL